MTKHKGTSLKSLNVYAKVRQDLIEEGNLPFVLREGSEEGEYLPIQNLTVLALANTDIHIKTADGESFNVFLFFGDSKEGYFGNSIDFDFF